MKRFDLFLAALLCSGAFLVGLAQDQLTIDATVQRSQRPPRGRGPFPGSATAGHSAGLPVRLELAIPNGEIGPGGTTTIDFVITNIGTEAIKLPFSVVLFDSEPREALTLWVSSDAIRDLYARDVSSGRLFKIEMVPISTE